MRPNHAPHNAPVRRVENWEGSLTLVGVVHDHPESIRRVQRVVESEDPNILALELPPLAIPTYRDNTLGEMSAAIQTARTNEVVGIDGPSTSYLVELARTLLEQRDLTLTRNMLKSFVSVSKTVVENRIQGVDEQPRIRQSNGPEHQKIQASTALINSLVENKAVTALEIEDATRERHMVGQLRKHCWNRETVAIVGIHHLDGIIEQLGQPNI